MDNQVMLKKTTFGGFEKQSVLNYIYELNTTTKEAQDKLLVQLEEITNSREKLSETLRDMETKMQSIQRERDNMVAELDGEKQRTGELGAMIDSLNIQIAKQERIISEKEEEIGDYRRLNNELMKKNETLESKKNEVEKASAYVGELLLRTRIDSESILEEASVKAQELVAEAGKSLEDVYTQFEAFKTDMAGIQAQIQDALTLVQQKFTGIGQAVNEAEGNLRDIVYPQTPTQLKLVQQAEVEKMPDIPGDSDFFRTAAEH